MASNPVLIASVTLCVLSTFAYRWRQKKQLPLPPSPKGDPIIAHLRCMPTEYEEVTYKAWSDELGSSIISLNLLGQVIVILDSVEDANELFVKRALQYSNRLQIPMLSSPRLTGWGNGTALLDYGDRWRGQRRITHDVLQKKTLRSMWPAIVKQTRLCMQRLPDTTDLESEIARMVGAVVLQSTYGYEATAADDPMVEIAKAGMRGFSDASMPADFLVNMLPWLEYIPSWLPGAGWKRKAISWGKARKELIDVPFNWTKQQMAAGAAQPSALNSLLTSLANDESDDDRAEEEDRIKWAIGALYGGAMDTTTSTLLVFILAMARNPEVQARAQEEVDTIIGDQRLPEMEDEANLPYIGRVIKEVLRWRPVVPLGLPHACAEDNTYKGYLIPKGAVVMGNAWAMCSNPKVYSDPERFNPDRFQDPTTPDPPAFGFGRRICPGQHFAEASVFMTVATMLSVFDIRPMKDQRGESIIPDAKLAGNSLVRRRGKKHNLPLPPSPRADPIISHLRYIPTEYEEIAYKKWSEELGSSIISINLLGQIIVILNSVEDANELLVKRAVQYSNRLQIPMLSSPRLTGWGNGTALLNYGDRWRGQRKVTHEVLQKNTLKSIWPAIVRQTRLSMQRLLVSGTTEFESEIARMVGAVVLQSTYGYEATAADDPMVEIAKAGMRGFSDASMPADFLVNVLPWLEYVPSWFPGAEWKRKAMVWSKARKDLVNVPFNWTKRQMAAGTARACILNSILTELATNGSESDQEEEEDRIKWAIGSLYGGAMDTTTSTILVFVLAMAQHPEIQKKAQEEIDAVIGDERLPEMEDQDNLPYIGRVIKEVLRWRPVAPLGVPHACAEENIYKGYSIPKNAIVMGNTWAICYNPEVYPDPESFNPERFSDPVTPEPPAFGFGRRICPGQHFAEASLFLAIATMLSVFDISPMKDEQGNNIISDAKLTGKSLIRIPLPFQCSLKVRSEAKQGLLFQA